LQGHPITEITTLIYQQNKTTVGCHKTAENHFITSEKLSDFAWSKTDQEVLLIVPGFSTKEPTSPSKTHVLALRRIKKTKSKKEQDTSKLKPPHVLG
jgi:hypothetical protein